MNTIQKLILFTIFCSTTALFAEGIDAKTEKVDASQKESKISHEFSAKTFFQWSQNLQNGQDNQFELKRIYLTWKGKFNKMFSAKITTDAFPLENEDNSGYDVLIKNAYLQIAPVIGPAKVALQTGMIGTPTVGIMNKFSGIRWVNNTYISDAKYMLKGLSIDTAADLGAKLSVELFGKVSITGAYTNGEGYKIVNTKNFYDGKSIHGMINYNAYKSIFVTAFIRSYGKSDTEDILYYGGALAWKVSAIKTGASFAYITNNKSSEKIKGYLIDTWVNINFKSFIGYPVLFIGKYAMGNYGDVMTNLIAGGPGYKFNKYAQCMIYIENYRKDSANTTKLYVKVEFKL